MRHVGKVDSFHALDLFFLGIPVVRAQIRSNLQLLGELGFELFVRGLVVRYESLQLHTHAHFTGMLALCPGARAGKGHHQCTHLGLEFFFILIASTKPLTAMSLLIISPFYRRRKLRRSSRAFRTEHTTHRTKRSQRDGDPDLHRLKRCLVRGGNPGLPIACFLC
jgi:hypothetical protein